MSFHTLLVANRGEIARRVFRTARARRTIDMTPAICLGPITAILALGQMKVKRLLKARPDMA